MKYEIGNPSDLCYITAEEDIMATACILHLGNGQYFTVPLDGDKGRRLPSFFALGGDVDATWKDAFGVTHTEFIEKPENREKMAKCFESFEYAHERSSLNNIGKRAKSYADGIRSKLTEEGYNEKS